MAQLAKRKGNGGLTTSMPSSFEDLFNFDRFFTEPMRNLPRLTKVPATNITELENEYLVELASPGLSKKDFEVEVNDNTLEICVEKEEESKEEKDKYTRREYDYRSFYRSFTLPENVQADKIKAEYKEGVLKVHLPKMPDSGKKPMKQISVD